MIPELSTTKSIIPAAYNHEENNCSKNNKELLPKQEHIQPPRVIFQCHMARQTMGCYVSDTLATKK